MGSIIFETYDRTLRRQFWSNLIDEQLRLAEVSSMRASLVINPYTGLSILAEAGAAGTLEQQAGVRRHDGLAAAG